MAEPQTEPRAMSQMELGLSTSTNKGSFKYEMKTCKMLVDFAYVQLA